MAAHSLQPRYQGELLVVTTEDGELLILYQEDPLLAGQALLPGEQRLSTPWGCLPLGPAADAAGSISVPGCPAWQL